PLLEQHSKLRTGEDFGVCMNPEFLRQESALSDFLKPSRIVIGELDKQSGDILEMLYAPFKAPIFRTDLDTAEIIKYVTNTFLTTKISFFNEMHTICRSLGLDPHFISEVAALDPRVGNYGIYGGRPFEGSCLPKDLEAFINFVKDKEHNPKLLDVVLYINKKMARTRTTKGETP
ncbi:MAG: UDP-glucose 6-dehydrogenase, partial [Candidatus Thorarchaeota archaeon]|nr:UDP-glucose 6-dehydrogenase [Candidatus Thorarchaeota archaeon]